MSETAYSPYMMTTPAAAFSAAPITDDEKIDIRQFCDYEMYGALPSSFDGWRFFQQDGQLEFKMINASPGECQRIRMYVAALNQMESNLLMMGDDLDTDKAAVFVRNKMERPERLAEFQRMRLRLCRFMGMRYGVNGAGNAARAGTRSI